MAAQDTSDAGRHWWSWGAVGDREGRNIGYSGVEGGALGSKLGALLESTPPEITSKLMLFCSLELQEIQDSKVTGNWSRRSQQSVSSLTVVIQL